MDARRRGRWAHRRPSVAYVLPVYNEAEGIEAFHADLVEVAACRPDLDVEFVYIDDGSRDDSLSRLLALRETDARVTVVALARNHGHQVAVTAGLDACVDVDAVVVMDTDGQDPPAVSLRMLPLWENGVDVVYGQRRKRQDTWFKRATASTFYWLLNRVSDVDIPRDVGDFRLMDRRVVGELARYREHDRFLRGIVAQIGFRQEAVRLRPRGAHDRDVRLSASRDDEARRERTPRVLHHAAPDDQSHRGADLIVSVGPRRLRLRCPRLRPGPGGAGWAFLGVGMFLLSGLQLVMMGVIGSYLGRVYVEAQGRPLYAVASVSRGTRELTQRLEPGRR